MTHIVRQQYLHVEVNGMESDGLALQRRLPGLCQNWLMPAIERVLERCAPPDGHHLTIERLEIDAGSLTLERLEHDLAESVAQAIEKSLREQIASIPPHESSSMHISGNVQRKTAQQSVHAAFIYFLKIQITPADFNKYGCDLMWRASDKASGREVAWGKTGILFFDYSARRPATVPEGLRQRTQG